MCPVKAFRDWMQDKEVKLSSQRPLFRLADGSNYTGVQLNKDLKFLLKDVCLRPKKVCYMGAGCYKLAC